MNIISIETSASTCAAAISVGENIIGNYSVFGNNLHDKLNAEFIRRLLEDNNMSINNIDAVAVSAGPGSFTGLRIGIAIAKALCFSEDSNNSAKLISVPTLSAFAYESRHFAKSIGAKEIVAAIPAHKDILYFQKFNIHGEEKVDIVMCTTTEFQKVINKDIVICGPLSKDIDKGYTLPYLQKHSVSFIARYAIKLYKENIFCNANEFTPMYIQEFEPRRSGKR